jgi:hypothetical protein
MGVIWTVSCPFFTHTHEEEPGATTIKSGRPIIQKLASPLSHIHAVCVVEKSTSIYFVSNEEETQDEYKMAAVTMAVERNRENKNRKLNLAKFDTFIEKVCVARHTHTHDASSNVGLSKSENSFHKSFAPPHNQTSK